MNITLPQLPYSPNALEPIISEETLSFHHGKHHQAYVNNLNKLVIGTAFENADLESIIQKSDGAIFNNAAQIWNHTFYFMAFTPNGNKTISDKLSEAIDKKWGSFENFKTEFSATASTLFGAGWAWLVANANGELEIIKTSNAENPMTDGLNPILTFDVWEHAYYIDYRNNRGKYIEELWKILDWKLISERYEK